jgi:hypothetical protein
MTLGGQGGDRAAVVAALRAVSGVADAEILPDPEGGPGTLRLQLQPGADEVRVAKTVNRLLGEKFGLGVDSGRVQVVEEVRRRAPVASPGAAEAAAAPMEQPEAAAAPAVVRPSDTPHVLRTVPSLAPPPSAPATAAPRARTELPAEPAATTSTATGTATATAAAAAAATEPVASGLGTVADLDPVERTGTARGTRLLIHRMQLVSANKGVTSEVTLELYGHEHTGTAGAASTPSSVHRSVAHATLRAVEEAVDGQVRFELEHVETTTLGADRAVVVEVAMITRHGSERLTGVSAVREDARQAVIRATLDAVNRRIETYLVSA